MVIRAVLHFIWEDSEWEGNVAHETCNGEPVLLLLLRSSVQMWRDPTILTRFADLGGIMLPGTPIYIKNAKPNMIVGAVATACSRCSSSRSWQPLPPVSDGSLRCRVQLHIARA